MSSNDNLMVVVIIFMLLLFWLVISYVNITQNVSSHKIVYGICQPGQCSLNAINGEKLCPENDTDSVTIDMSYQYCCSKYFCETSQMPYAITLNGSTNSLGVCPEGVACRCSNKPLCSSDLTAVFRSSGVINDNPGNKTSFSQIAIYSQGYVGSQTLLTSSTGSDYCLIKPYHLNRIGSGNCYFADPINPSLEEVTYCMNSNPCLVGVLAFYPQDPNAFVFNEQNTNAIYNIPVGCVAYSGVASGEDATRLVAPCNSNQVPVWSSKTASIICIDTTI